MKLERKSKQGEYTLDFIYDEDDELGSLNEYFLKFIVSSILLVI